MAAGSNPSLVDITDGNFGLDLDALSKVLCQPEIEDKPVVVVGIAGAMRTGKSFALSFLMRYLRHEGWRNTSWIADGESCAQNGIEWRGGRRPDTKGIRVWSGIFKVEKDDGDQLSVLLVDTQGLFDKTMKKEDNMRLMTFTILLCSRLMLNMKDQINDRELEYLQFFTQYGKTVLEESGSGTPFQDLMFLIRDWQYPQDNPYGLDGGQAYLTDVFKEAGNEERDGVCRDLSSTFRNVQSFLMPHPGQKVTSVDFQGNNGELDPKFLECIEELARTIFDPSTLKERLHSGEALTGRQLWSLLNDCNRSLQDGAAPEVHNMVEGFARMRNRLACEEGLKKFNEKFNEATTEDRDALYHEAQDTALKYFKENTNFGPEKFREEYRQRLILDCQDQLRRTTVWNEYRELKAKNFSSEKLHEVWINYKEAMKRDMEEQVIERDVLDGLHLEHSGVALMEYQAETAQWAAFNKEHLQILEDFIGESYSKLKDVNEDRGMLVTLGGLEDNVQEYEAYLLFHSIKQQYSEELEKYSTVYIEEQKLKEQIDKIQQSYFDAFSENWDRDGPEIDEFRANLLELFAKEYQDCLKHNERNKVVFKDNIDECIMGMKLEYQEKMHRLIERSYCDPSDLRKAHDHIVDKLLEDALRNGLGELEIPDRDAAEARARREFSAMFENLSEANQRNRQEQPRIDWDAIKDSISDGVKFATTVTLVIRRFKALLRTVESTHSAVRPLLGASIVPSAEALAVLTIGVAAAAAASVVAYRVYKHYKNRKAIQN